MTRRAKSRVGAVVLLGLALLVPAGCSRWQPPDNQRQQMAADLADALREEALKLPDGGQRERLITGLLQLREVITGQETPLPGEPPATSAAASAESSPRLPPPPGGAKPAPPWATMFAPASLVIGFFTRSRDFDGQPGDDGLEVRLQPLDQFGDPAKAVGSYRIEVFQYRLHTTEKRGERLGHWFVSVLDAESTRKFYDPVDRSYVFPLLWDNPIPQGSTVIVQATYYPPGGFQQKLFAQRLIKVGPE